MSPFIRSFQDNVSNWVSSLIHQQDGCPQMVAQQATQGRLRQEQLAQTVARCAAMPSQQDQAQYLYAQLAHREAQQLEQVRAERDNHFIQEEHLRIEKSVHSNSFVRMQTRVLEDCLTCPAVCKNILYIACVPSFTRILNLENQAL